MTRLFGLSLVAAALMALAIAGTALARPGNGVKALTVTLECDNGESYEGVVQGRGRWAPFHVDDSKTRLQPTAFLSFEGVRVDKNGMAHDASFEDPIRRGNGNVPEGAEIVTCDYTVTWLNERTGESLDGEGVVEGYFKQEEDDEGEGVSSQQQGQGFGKLNNPGKGKGKNKNR